MIGPGTYNTSLSSTGKQLLAKNKTEKAFAFGKNIRETMNEKTLSPGPGAYQHYSIFGLLWCCILIDLRVFFIIKS